MNNIYMFSPLPVNLCWVRFFFNVFFCVQCSQIDLAHHTPPPPPSVAQQIYPTNLIFSSARGNVPISHPSQIDRLPPPALFSNDNNSSMESVSLIESHTISITIYALRRIERQFNRISFNN